MSARRLALLLAGAALLAPAAPAAAQSPTTLVVIETAEVRATPDTAIVSASIRRVAGRAAVARRRVERSLAVKLRALAALGVTRTDIRTDEISSFRIRSRGRTLFRAATSLRIRTTDLPRLERILGALGGADLEGPEFSVSDSTAARQEATRVALDRARRRADAAAAAVGLRVAGIRRVDLNPEFGYGAASIDFLSGEDESTAGGGGTNPPITVEPGQEEITVAVAVIYDLAP